MSEPMKLEERIEAAIKRITSGHAAMRVPAEETDPDLVLSDCLALAARHRELVEAASRVVKAGDEFAKAAINCGESFEATQAELEWRKEAADAYDALRRALRSQS